MKAKILTTIILIILTTIKVQSQDTFSIVAVDLATGEVGSAGASCVDLNKTTHSNDFLGELFPGIGAINTQAHYKKANQIKARDRMNLGETPSQIIQWLINNDNDSNLRQYGIVAIVNELVESAAHTGVSTDNHKNHITGSNYSIQGNKLLGDEVLNSMETKFLNTNGDLACKLMATLQGANMIGADTRCSDNGTSSLFAFVKVAQPDDTFGNPSFILSVRTSDGDGIEPIDSLQTLFDNNHNCTSLLEINDNESIKSHFSIYPNPVNDIITFKNKDFEIYKLEVINVTGIVLYQTTFQNNLKMDVSTFQKGIYFIRVSNNSQSYVTKMIKN